MKYFLSICFLLFNTAYASAQLSQNGLLFDGVDDKVLIPNNAAYNVGNGNISIEAWIRADAIGATYIWEYIVSTYTGNNSGFGFSLTYAGSLSFTINGSGYGPSATVNLRDGLCHHVAVVRKDTLVSYYIDGALLPGTASWSAAINTTNPLYISNPTPNAASPGFKGLIKEVRIWNVARTQGEILSNMNAVPAAATTGLIGYWRMNATSGQTVTDFSPTANNGVLGTTSSVETLDPAFSTGCPSCTQTTAVVTAGGPTSFCIGDSVLLSANTGLNFQYQWYKNGVAIAGATNATTYAKLTGVYTVRLTNSGGCTSTSNGVQVYQLLDNAGYISCSGITVGTWACLNGGNTRTLSVNTGPGYLYQWQRNGLNIGGLTGNTISVSTAGVYTCIVTASGCSRTTTSFTLGPNPVTVSTSGSSTVCTGPVFLMATRTYGSSSGVTYDWKLNGVSLGAANNWTYNAAQSGSYTCTVTDAICPGTFTSNALGVSVGTLPQVYISPNPLTQVLSDCNSSQLLLSATLSNGSGYPVNDPGITSVDWYQDGSLLTSFTGAVNVDRSGIYDLYVNSPTCGTSISQPKVVLMTNAIIAPQISHGNLTNCTQVALSVPNYWLGFQWKLNGIVIPGAVTNNYTATQSGNYTCELSNACGSVTTPAVQVTISGGVQPVITAPSGTVICGTANKVLVAPTGTGYTYQWKLNGNNVANGNLNAYYTNVAGNYTCMVTTSCGAQLSNTITLTTGLPAPAAPVKINGKSIGVCSSTVNYSISSIPQATNYTWTIPSGATLLSGQGTTTVSVAFSSSFGADSIKVFASNSCGAGPSKALGVKGRPALPGAITGPVNVCAGQPALGYTISPVAGATSYTWTKPTGSVITNGQGTTQLTLKMGSASGPLKVKSVNACGASANVTLALNVVCREEGLELMEPALVVSPNPSSGAFEVHLKNAGSEEAQGFVFNGLGQLVEQFELNSGVAEGVGANLPAGFYFIKVLEASKTLTIPVTKQ